MAKTRKTRVCLRLPVDFILALRKTGRPMTDTVNEALFDLVHSLQAERVPASVRAFLQKQWRSDYALLSCQFRLEALAVEYLKFNGYNLTTCIKYALLSPTKQQELWTYKKTN